MGPTRSVRTRGTSNGNASGSSHARRTRKRRMLSPEGGHGGNGTTVPCYRCKAPLTYETLTVDRKVAGMDGGSYAWENCQPACEGCNIETGNQLKWHRRKFPLGSPVVFARNRKFWTVDKVLWDIIDGEDEPLLTLRSRATGRRRYNVSRAHLLAVGEPREVVAA
jgi:hypothetical protein